MLHQDGPNLVLKEGSVARRELFTDYPRLIHRSAQNEQQQDEGSGSVHGGLALKNRSGGNVIITDALRIYRHAKIAASMLKKLTSLFSTIAFLNLALEAAHPGMTLRQRIARLGKGEGDGFVYTAPVASLKSNRRGLFDTHGNVWEWCSDRFHPRYYSELTGASVMNSDPLRLPVVVDPNGPETTIHHKYGDWRAVRGGAWCTGPLTSRSAERSFAEATDAFVYTGFRVVAETTLKE
jgi:hypothetical protein